MALSPLADSYANEGAKTASTGSSSSLASRGSLGATSYLRFDLPAAPAGQHLASAVLEVSTNTSSTAGSVDAHQVKVAGNEWSENSLTWNNRPATDVTLGEVKGAAKPNTRYAASLDPQVLRPWVGEQTLALTSSGSDILWLWSNNHVNADGRPRLVLTYTDIPVVPTVVEVRPVADTYANAGAKAATHASSSSLASRGSLGATSFLKFELPPVPDGKSLSSAVLSVSTNTSSTAGSTDLHEVKLAGSNWDEGSLSWTSMPPIGWTIGELRDASKPDARYSVELNPLLLPAVTGTVTMSLGSSGSDILWLWSSNYVNEAERPTLTLTYR